MWYAGLPDHLHTMGRPHGPVATFRAVQLLLLVGTFYEYETVRRLEKGTRHVFAGKFLSPVFAVFEFFSRPDADITLEDKMVAGLSPRISFDLLPSCDSYMWTLFKTNESRIES